MSASTISVLKVMDNWGETISKMCWFFVCLFVLQWGIYFDPDSKLKYILKRQTVKKKYNI